MDLRSSTLKAVSFCLLHNISTLNQCRKLSCGTVVCEHFASYQGYLNYRWDLIWYAKGCPNSWWMNMNWEEFHIWTKMIWIMGRLWEQFEERNVVPTSKLSFEKSQCCSFWKDKKACAKQAGIMQKGRHTYVTVFHSCRYCKPQYVRMCHTCRWL
jgi:hypothetical protein